MHYRALKIVIAAILSLAAAKPGLSGVPCSERVRYVQVTSPLPLPLQSKPATGPEHKIGTAAEGTRYVLGKCLVVGGYRFRWCQISSARVAGWINSYYLTPIDQEGEQCHRQSDPDRKIAGKKSGVASEAENWTTEAKAHLRLVATDKATTEIPAELFFSSSGWRCPRLNNYWCVKTRSQSLWPGQLQSDEDGHAVFKDAKHGAAAAYLLLKDYWQNRNRHTLTSMMCAYAPNSDCIGSEAGRSPDGQCTYSSNDCEAYAQSLAETLNVCADCKLKLFSNGAPEPLVVDLMKQIARFEISHPRFGIELVPTTSVVEEGIAIADRQPEEGPSR